MSTTATLIFQRLIADAAARGASDVHLSPGQVAMLRVNGALVPAGANVVDPPLVEEILREILSPQERERLGNTGRLTLGRELSENVRAKIIVRAERGVHSLAVRLVPGNIPSLEQLGFSSAVANLASSRHGLIIISGPHDAGKSTTLAAFLQTLNASRRSFLVTLEAPIEYVLQPHESIIEQREVGRDVADFATGLSELKTEDVEVIAVADLPDGASVESALELVRSGRLVLVVVEVAQIAQVMVTLLGRVPESARQASRALMADSLVAVIHQKLVPKIAGGRRLVFDLLLPTTPVKGALREDRLALLPNIIATSRAEGMISLDQMLVSAVTSGEVKLEDALQVANDPQALRK